MTIHAFIITWAGTAENAKRIEDGELSPHVDYLTVINNDTASHQSHWHKLPDDTRASAHLNAVKELNRGERCLVIMADAECDWWPAIEVRSSFWTGQSPCGVYAPNIDWTGWPFKARKLPLFRETLRHVPQTDSIVFCVRKSVLDAIPTIDTSINQFGWGWDTCMVAISHMQDWAVVRDYAFTVKHPQSSHYNRDLANQQMINWLNTLPQDIIREIARNDHFIRYAQG